MNIERTINKSISNIPLKLPHAIISSNKYSRRKKYCCAKMRKKYCCAKKRKKCCYQKVFFQYFFINIGLFSIAPCKVIPLNLLSFISGFSTFLYCSLYKYQSINYCDSFILLEAKKKRS